MATILGDDSDNYLYGSDADDTIDAFGGDDDLFGGAGNDQLAGGKGNDRLDGGPGNDNVHFQRGDGNDLVFNYDRTPGKVDAIVFGDLIAPADLELARDGYALVIGLKGGADRIVAQGFFETPEQRPDAAPLRPLAIDQLRFADGSSWDRVDILTQVQLARAPLEMLADKDDNYSGVNLDGGVGNDVLWGMGDSLLRGGSGDDLLNGGFNAILEGGSGNDRLLGGDGENILAGGAGNDSISVGGGHNMFIFGRGDGQDVIELRDAWQAQVIVLGDALPGAVATSRSGDDLVLSLRGSADQITLANYFQLNAGITSHISVAFAGGAAWSPDQLRTAAYLPPPTVIEGGSGDDMLTGTYGNDILLGKDGNDWLDGGDGNDLLEGGAGFDSLYGGSGDDTLDAGAGDAWLDGGMGTNMILMGRDAGAYRLAAAPYVDARQIIALDAGIAPADLALGFRSASEFELRIKDANASLVLPAMVDQDGQFRVGGAELHFADGTVWGADALLRFLNTGDEFDNFLTGLDHADDTLYGLGGHDELFGRGGNDTLDGGDDGDFLLGEAGNDVLLGGAGHDLLLGGMGDDILDGGAGDDGLGMVEGHDTMLFGRGAGVDQLSGPMTWDEGSSLTIMFGAGVLPSDLVLTLGEYNTLVTAIRGSGDQFEYHVGSGELAPLFSKLSYRFADGSSWDGAAILRALYTGDEGGNAIYGTEAGNELRGLGGNDVLDGRGGDDLVLGGDGDDLVMGGDGQDTLEGGAGFDVLEGNAGADQLAGGSGDDLLNGGDGDDVYLFHAGDGRDKIQDTVGANVVRFGSGITAAQLHAEMAPGGDLVIYLGNGDELRVVDIMGYGNGSNADVVARFEFADGSAISGAELLNRAPVVSAPLGVLFATENKPFEFSAPAGGFTDPDLNDVLSYQIGMADGSALPSWLTASGLQLGGTPGFEDSGTVRLRLTATDKAGLSAVDTFELQVENTNRAPVAGYSIPAQSAPAGSAFSYQIPFSAFSDPDFDSGTLSVKLAGGAPLPAWLAFDPATGALSGTPASSDTAVLELAVTFTDGGGLAAQNTLRLNVNATAPVVANPVADAGATELQPFSMNVPASTFSDADSGDVLALALTRAGGAALPSWLHYDAATGVLSGTPQDANTGTLDLQLRATDRLGLSATDTFRITVAGVNQAPFVKWAADDMTIPEGYGFGKRVATFADPDAADQLALSLAMADGTALPSWMSFDAQQGWVNGSLGYETAGSYVLRATATDSGGLAVSSDFRITVTDVNRAPLLNQAIAAQSVDDGAAFGFVLPAATFRDPDAGDSGTLSAIGMPAWLAFDPATGAFSGTAAYADIGSAAVTVRVTDRGGLAAEATMQLAVTKAASVTLAGTAQADTLTGKSNHDSLSGLDGDDQLYGMRGDDQLMGGAGNDWLDGGPGADSLAGGGGNELFIGGAGSDTIAAIGGDLAWLYAVNGSLNAVAAQPALAIAADAGFGTAMQTLLVGSALVDGTPLLY